MKTNLLFLFFAFVLANYSFTQTKDDIQKLLEEGVEFHDKGDYEGAIKKYDEVLKLDTDNLTALAEKAFSLMSLNKNDEAIACCKKGIEKHPGDENLNYLYVTYGNALDGLKKSEEALMIYEEGLKLFPNFHMLHFNKGITLWRLERNDEAIGCFQKSISIQPTHPGSHNALARILNLQGNRIPAILAYSRFLVLEPQSNRAKENLGFLLTQMNGNIDKTGKKSVTINISPDMLSDTTEASQSKENNFSSTDLILSLTAALDYDKKNKKKSDVEKFIRKFETMCASLKELQPKNHGFYWEYYAPYFIDMKDNNQLETFAYIAFATSEDKKVKKWLDGHKKEIGQFYNWSKTYKWPEK
jgi:tetratricopeptide (TPR) repeat protein